MITLNYLAELSVDKRVACGGVSPMTVETENKSKGWDYDN